MDTVRWWLATTPFDGFAGAPAGPPEWPFPGGQLHQPGKLVEAVDVLRAEWNQLAKPATKPAGPAVVKKERRRR